MGVKVLSKTSTPNEAEWGRHDNDLVSMVSRYKSLSLVSSEETFHAMEFARFAERSSRHFFCAFPDEKTGFRRIFAEYIIFFLTTYITVVILPL